MCNRRLLWISIRSQHYETATLLFQIQYFCWAGQIKKGIGFWMVLDRTRTWQTQLMSLKFRNFGEFGWFCNSVFGSEGFEFRSEVCYVLVWSNTNPKILEFSNISLFWQLDRKIRGHKFDTFFSLFDWIAIDILSSKI